MDSILTCGEVEEQNLVGRYLARTLTPAEEAAFEAHFLTCEQCQEALRVGGALRTELAGMRPGGQATRRHPWVWTAAAGGLLAASIAGLLLLRGSRGDGQLARLGRVARAPAYAGVPVRASDETRGDSLFAVAMRAYSVERYGAAAAGLRAALSAGGDSLPAVFFLGSSLLLMNRPAAAAIELKRAIALGESPYLTEAHYYRGKALLRLGKASEALAELVAAAQRGDATAARAATLADSVKDLLRRSR